MQYEVNIEGTTLRLELEKKSSPQRKELWLCRLKGREITVDATLMEANRLSLVIGGKSFEIRRESNGETSRIVIGGNSFDISFQDLRSLKSRKRTAAGNSGLLKLTAAMPGKVVRILAKEGESLQSGTGIIVIEAMKMQNELRSPKDGTLKQLLVKEGANVNAGDVVAVLE